MINFITYGASGHKVAHVVTSRSEYLAIRGSEQNKHNFELARKGDRQAKMRLAQFNYNDMMPNGKVSGACHPTDTFVLDIDLGSEPECNKLAAQILEKKQEINLLMLERTVNYGLHLVCKRELGKTILENQVRLSILFKTEMDTNNKDLSRVLFSSTDAPEELLFLDDRLFECGLTVEQSEKEYELLEDRKKNNLENVPEGAKRQNKHFKPWETIVEPVKNEAALYSSDNYCGIPYADIIDKYWELHNGGQTPITSNRDTLTYELANSLKHICGFDRQLLDRVIPCYDGFPEAEKLKCIDSALGGKRTQMPKKLVEVLNALRKGNTGNKELVAGVDELVAHDELFHYDLIPESVKEVGGIKDTLDAAGHSLAMPALISMCPAVGALATGVQLDVHGVSKHLNLISFNVGKFGTCKSQIDNVVTAWMHDLIEEANYYNKEEKKWNDEYKRKKNTQTEISLKPRFPKRWQTLNSTTANMAERLENCDGKHAFSFTAEADIVASRLGKVGANEYSTMIRNAYDGAPYDREAKSADACNVHIANTHWNVVMCGTEDALYRVVPNCTDGFQSRIAIAKIPDNTFDPLDEHPAVMTDVMRENIIQLSRLLPLMNGSIVMPELEKKGRQWLEEIRLLALGNGDTAMAAERKRTCVTTQRMVCCLILDKVADKLIREHGFTKAEQMLTEDKDLWKRMALEMQTEDMLKMFDIIADYLLENSLYYFRKKLESDTTSQYFSAPKVALNSSRTRRSKNDTIFESLGVDFTYEEALAISRDKHGKTENAVQQMLKNWRNQNLVETAGVGKYHKISA